MSFATAEEENSGLLSPGFRKNALVPPAGIQFQPESRLLAGCHAAPICATGADPEDAAVRALSD
jgi:hypothetical protein